MSKGITIGDSSASGTPTISTSEKDEMKVAVNGFHYKSKNKKHEFSFLDFSAEEKHEGGDAHLDVELTVAGDSYKVNDDNSLAVTGGLVFSELSKPSGPPRLTFKLSGSYTRTLHLKGPLPEGAFYNKGYSTDLYKDAEYDTGLTGIPTAFVPKGFRKKVVLTVSFKAKGTDTATKNDLDIALTVDMFFQPYYPVPGEETEEEQADEADAEEAAEAEPEPEPEMGEMTGADTEAAADEGLAEVAGPMEEEGSSLVTEGVETAMQIESTTSEVASTATEVASLGTEVTEAAGVVAEAGATAAEAGEAVAVATEAIAAAGEAVGATEAIVVSATAAETAAVASEAADWWTIVGGIVSAGAIAAATAAVTVAITNHNKAKADKAQKEKEQKEAHEKQRAAEAKKSHANTHLANLSKHKVQAESKKKELDEKLQSLEEKKKELHAKFDVQQAKRVKLMKAWIKTRVALAKKKKSKRIIRRRNQIRVMKIDDHYCNDDY